MKDGNLLEYVIKNDNIREVPQKYKCNIEIYSLEMFSHFINNFLNSQRMLIRFCRDICNGMAFLHSHQVLHKDLAARNILLSDKTAKIADLGLSSFLTNDEGGIYAVRF